MQRREFILSSALFDQLKVEVNLVNVPFSVQNDQGKWVTNLSISDIEVTEDGIPQNISFFSPASNSPLSIAVLADVSASQARFLNHHRNDLIDFVKAVLRPRDQAALVCFSGTIRLVSNFTSNFKAIHESLEAFEKSNRITQFPQLGPSEIRTGGTVLYDAIIEATIRLQQQSGRRALLIFSDGDDNDSARNLFDAVEAAQIAGVAVFPIRYTDLKRGLWNSRNKHGLSVLARLALETGGQDFDGTNSRSLNAPFQWIASLLRASYDLAYQSSQPARDNTFRKIRITARQPGFTTRHKTGYYARP